MGDSMFAHGGHALWRTLASVKPKPSESSTYCSHYSALQKFVDVCVCVCVLTNLPLLFQIPPSHPLPPISLSHPLSCAHSLILSRAKNWQSSSSSQKLPSSHWLRQPGLCNSFRTPLYSPPPPTLGLPEITNEGWRWFISRFIAYPCMD